MKLQRRFAPTGGEFAPESVARFIGICTLNFDKEVECMPSHKNSADF
jgi:hypothetical protein